MRNASVRFHVLIGIVLLAILTNTLAPTFLSAAGVKGKTLWMPLCAAGASKSVPVTLSGGSGVPGVPDENAPSQAGHCVFCVTRIDPLTPSLSLPPARWIGAVLAYLPALFLRAPQTPFVWANAQPRAPPFLA